MKKIISFLVSLCVLLSFFSASCDEYLSIQFDCNVQPELSNSWQIWNNGTRVRLTDSMHTDYVIELKTFEYPTFIPYDHIMLMIMQHSGLNTFLSLIDQITESESETEQGYYTGDCFDMAIYKKEIILNSDNIDQMILILSTQSLSSPAYHGDVIISQWLKQIKCFLEEYNSILKAQIYDNGKYYTFQTEKNNTVINTLSINRTDTDNINGVFSFSEKDRIYDIGFQSMTDDNKVFLTVSVCSDPDQAGYRIACATHPIIHMECSFHPENDNQMIKCVGYLSSADDQTLMNLNGNIRPNTENELFSINIQNSRDNKSWGDLRIIKENTEYNQENQYVVSVENRDEGSFEMLKMSYEQYFMVLLNCFVNPSFSQ